MQTVDQLIERIETEYQIGQPTNCYRAVTDESYVVIGSQSPAEPLPSIPGTVDEGCAAEYGYDEETAVMQAWACFSSYAEGRNGILYWRVRPVLETYENRHVVYMRCLISSSANRRQPCDRCNCGYASGVAA